MIPIKRISGMSDCVLLMDAGKVRDCEGDEEDAQIIYRILRTEVRFQVHNRVKELLNLEE